MIFQWPLSPSGTFQLVKSFPLKSGTNPAGGWLSAANAKNGATSKLRIINVFITVRSIINYGLVDEWINGFIGKSFLFLHQSTNPFIHSSIHPPIPNASYRYGFVDEHYGDVPADRIQKFSVLAQEAGVDLFGDGLTSAVARLAGRNSVVQLGNQRRVRQLDALLRFRTAEIINQFGMQH